jgi:glycerophosphoryl diester phosphodiesterase
MKTFFVLTFMAIFSYSMSQQQLDTLQTYAFDVHGHRGARGLAPENSLPAFKKALALGVNALELDLVISKDQEVVVSHEPWMNHQICLTPEGKTINAENQKKLNLYQMDYQQIKKYDCGSKAYSNYPDQVNQTTYKPKLSEVIKLVQSSQKQDDLPVYLNIEIKSLPQGDNIYHPPPKKFVDLVVNVLDKYQVQKKDYNLQSFDFRVLQAIHRSYPDIRTAALVYQSSFETSLDRLGYKPAIYSPYFPLVDLELVKSAHQKSIKVIPWTVNSIKNMLDLLKLGVDGIITDYPNRAMKIKK